MVQWPYRHTLTLARKWLIVTIGDICHKRSQFSQLVTLVTAELSGLNNLCCNDFLASKCLHEQMSRTDTKYYQMTCMVLPQI